MKLSDLFFNRAQLLDDSPATIEIERVTQAIIAGKLGERIDTAGLSGEALRFGNSINLMLNAMVQPLHAVSAYAERVAKGDTPPRITDTYSGDFNVIKDNLNAAMDAIDQQTAAARAIAEGDLSVKVGIRGGNDELAKSLLGIIDAQQGLKKELMRLTDASRDGQLSERGNSKQFRGAYGEMIAGVNEMLDAILLPIGEG
ncbi:HAMP domain-containing protein, partial [Methylomonas sp. SURF-2]